MSIYTWGHMSKGCIYPAHSQREWDEVVVRCAFRCFYCAVIIDADHPPTKDHLVPLIRGGCECRGNLVCSCLRCNSMKKQKTVAEFLHMKPALVETSGKFYTTITLLESFCPAQNDPLLKSITELAQQKRFPPIPSYREPEPSSPSWRKYNA